MYKRLTFVLGLSFLFSCTSGVQNESNNKTIAEPVTKNEAEASVNVGYYNQVKVDSIPRISYPDFDTFESYQYKDYKLLIGMFKSQPGRMSPNDSETDYGMRLLALDKNNKLVFRSHGNMDAHIYNIRFYKVDEQSSTLLVADIGNEGPWGSVVFSIDDRGVKKVGDIDLAGIHREDNAYDNISNFTTIKKEGKNVIFRFTCDSVIIDPFGITEKVIASKGLYYLYDGKEMKAARD